MQKASAYLEKLSQPDKTLLFFKVICAMLLAGRAWQHFSWDVPYRAILWNQSLMQGLVRTLFGMRWSEYASSDTVDTSIYIFQAFIGTLLLGAMAAAILIRRQNRLTSYTLYGASTGLFLLALLYFFSKFWQVGMLIELTSQFMTPMFLVWLANKPDYKHFDLFLRIAVALTFLGHGLYAIGIHPVPGHFIDMVILSLHVSETTARGILAMAGAIDILIAIAIFIPRSDIYKPLLIWAITWGFLTALARVYAHVSFGNLGPGLDRWLYETILRAPHYGVPALLLLRHYQTKSQ